MPSYFGERFGERWGMRFGSFGAGVGENQQPYEIRTDPNSLLAKSIYSTADPISFALNFGALPLKLSLGRNALRSAWWASRAIGLTSSLKDPFDPKRAVWGYRARTTRGLVSKIVGGIDRAMDNPVTRMLKEGTVTKAPELYSGDRFFKAGGKGIGVRRGIPPVDMKYFRGSIRGEFKRAWKESGFMHVSPSARRAGTGIGKFVYSSEVEDRILATATGGARPLGMLEKFVLRPGNIIESIRKESPLLADYITKDMGEDAFVRSVVKNMKSLKDTPYTEQMVKASMEAQQSSRTSVLGYLKKSFTAKGRDEISDSWKKFWGGLEEGEFKKKPILRYTKSKTFARNMYRSSEALKQSILDTETSRVAAARRSGAGYFAAEAESAMGAYAREEMGMESLVSGTRGRAMIADVSDTISRRMRNLRIWKGIGAAAVVAPFVLSAMKTVIQKGLEVPGRMAATMRKMNMMEFGTGEVLTNARLSSDRQRAVSAIQNAQLNARYLMGNEAPLYH